MSTKADFEEKIACKVCGKEYSMITPQHLGTHKLTLDEYKEKYPDAVLKSGMAVMRGECNLRNDLFKKEEEKGLSLLEQISNPKKVNEIKSLKLKEIEEIFIEKEDFSNVSKGKLNILNFLTTKFKSVKNNFFIEKYAINGRLDFKYITDIVLYDEGVDLEFDNSFWHNFNHLPIQRDIDLKSLGWKIIRIESKNPTVEEVEKILQENKLIR